MCIFKFCNRCIFCYSSVYHILILYYFADNKYINVQFDEDLKHGARYYICVYAKEKVVEHEKWTEILPEVKECSDGVVVDLTKPTEGRVWVNRLRHIQYQVSSS